MSQVSYGTITITDTNDIERIYVVYAKSTTDTTAPSATADTWSESISTAPGTGDYVWQRTAIEQSGTHAVTYGNPVCVTGPQGGTGPAGRGIASIVTTYCNYGTGTPTESYSGWQSTVPTYDSTKPNYWVKTVVTYTSGSPLTNTTIYKDNASTDAIATSVEANQTAAIANSIAQHAQEDAEGALSQAVATQYQTEALSAKLKYFFWPGDSNYPGVYAASAIDGVTFNEENISTYGYNVALKPASISIGYNNIKAIVIDGSNPALKFYSPSKTTQATNPSMELSSTALTFNNPTTGQAQLTLSASGSLQSGNYSRGNNIKFANAGTKIDLTSGDIITQYFRLSQGGESGGPNAGAYIYGTIEALDGRIGTGYTPSGGTETNYWDIGNFTDYNLHNTAKLIGHGSSFIQLGDDSTWRLATNRIHTGWYISSDSYLHFLQFTDGSETKRWDYGMHVPTSKDDKFLYIRNASSTTSLANLIYDLEDTNATHYWTYKFWVDGSGNVHAPGFYVGDSTTPIGGGANTIAQKIINQDGSTYGKGSTTQPIYIDSSGYVQTVGWSSETSLTNSDAKIPTSAAVKSFVEGKGYVTSSGVTSVRVQASDPLQSSTSTAQTSTLNTTISFKNQNNNVVLAGPSSGSSAAAPTFRALVAADIPDLSGTYLTSETTYSFTGGTNKFTVTPSRGTAYDVEVTPSINNNVTGSGTSGSLVKWNGTNTVTNGPVLGTDTTKFLNNKGEWAVPGGTYSLVTATYNTLGGVKPWYSTTGSSSGPTAATYSSNVTVNERSTTSGRYYPIEIDTNGRLFVNIPWTNVNSNYLTSSSTLNWNNVTQNRPTTLSGYGITDAKIANGVITLGSNTITPLTSFTETDPIFSASVAATIQDSDITNWNSKTSNTGTVTSVRVQASSPLQSSTSTAQSTSLNTTISFANQNKNLVLAGPASGTSAAAPTFRALVAADIPDISGTYYLASNPSGYTTNTGTVTSVKVQGSDGLTGSGTVTSSGTITIKHATGSGSSSSNSGRTYIQSITLDTYGHVTNISTATETVTNTHNTAYLYAGASNGSANAETTNGNTYLILVDGGSATTRRKISGSGTVSVTSDASGNISITGTAHPTTLPNPKTLTIRAYNSTSTTASYTDSTYYGGENSNTTISVASTNAVTNISSNNSGQLILTRADGSQSNPITVKITATTSDTAASADKLNLSEDVGSTSVPVYFPATSGLPVAVSSIAYNLLPTGTTASTVAIGNHTHGNLTTDGKITSTATIASGDKLVIVDSDTTAGSKITGSSITFGTSTTTFLTNKGTWATPPGTTYSAGTGLSLSSTEFSVKLDYTTSGNNRKVQADTNGNLYVVQTDSNTTYTFTSGTNGFTVTPSGGTAQTVSVTPSITNNVTGSGTSGKIVKWNGTNTVTDGPAFSSTGTGYLKEDGTWGTPGGTYTLPLAASGTRGGVQIGYSESGTNYAVKLSSEKMYVTVPWTDENVKSTAVTAATTNYIVGSTTSTTTTGGLSKHASAAIYTTADSGTSGYAQLRLGNTTATSSAGGKEGQIRLYGTTATYYVDLKAGAPSAARTITFPNATGTVALTSNIPTTTQSATTGITASTTANKVTVGSHSTDYGVKSAGSGSFTSGAFSGGSGSFGATVSSHVLSFSHTHTAATHGADSHTHTAPTLGSKVPTVTSESATVTITDNGHSHSI